MNLFQLQTLMQNLDQLMEFSYFENQDSKTIINELMTYVTSDEKTIYKVRAFMAEADGKDSKEFDYSVNKTFLLELLFDMLEKRLGHEGHDDQNILSIRDTYFQKLVGKMNLALALLHYQLCD